MADLDKDDPLYWIKYMDGKKCRRTMQPITHRMKIVLPQFESMKKTGEMGGKFKRPDSLTILTCHDYKEKSLFEQNMDFLGIEGYVVLRPNKKPYKDIYKIELAIEYLKNSNEKTPYVLLCDARDVIIKDDPDKIVKIFEHENCDLLFNSTMFPGGWICMIDKYKWACSVNKKGRYLNAGVIIGKWDFMLEVFEYASRYITPYSLTAAEYRAKGRALHNYTICKLLPDFPKGSVDQDIFRYIHDKFYPRMEVDYANHLVYRN